jgi:competence protein ComEC
MNYQNIYNRLIQTLQEEYLNLPIWGIICFISGIIYYFSLGVEPQLQSLLLIGVCLFFALYLSRKYFVLKLVWLAIMMFLLGMIIPAFKFHNFAPIGLKQKIVTNLVGEVEAIKPKEFGWQILLKNPRSNNILPEETPKKVRFNLHDIGSNKLLLGDVISIKLSLMPPPGALIPGGYDFSKQAFFNEIGAVGYNKSDPIIINHKLEEYSFYHWFQALRRNIYDRIILNLGDKVGNFAAAIIVGETSGIELNIINSMRRSGLAHILCVSGIHISLVAMIFFLSIRIFLNIFNFIAYNYDIKKIGAIFAIIGSFLYLLISGMQVAATRAFIMTSVYLASIFLDKRSNAIRSVFFAALIILLIWPEYILHPSFILSFTAVISLIACAGYNFTPFEVVHSKKGIFHKFKKHIILNISSTLAASIATTPFVLYFFHVNPNYSLIANLIAVPITTFILMPAAVSAILLIPLSLDYFAWGIVEVAINSIIKVANFTSSLPFASWYFGHLEEKVILFYAFAFIVFCVGKKQIKTLGVILLLISVGIIFKTPKPDLIIDGKTGIFAAQIDSKLFLSSDKLGNFKAQYWASWFGQSDIQVLNKQFKGFETNSKNYVSICKKGKCECGKGVFINLKKNSIMNCPNLLVNREMLQEFGTILVYCDANNCNIKYSNNKERFIFK